MTGHPSLYSSVVPSQHLLHFVCRFDRQGGLPGEGSWGSGFDPRNVHSAKPSKLPHAHGQEAGHIPEELRGFPKGRAVKHSFCHQSFVFSLELSASVFTFLCGRSLHKTGNRTFSIFNDLCSLSQNQEIIVFDDLCTKLGIVL